MVIGALYGLAFSLMRAKAPLLNLTRAGKRYPSKTANGSCGKEKRFHAAQAKSKLAILK